MNPDLNLEDLGYDPFYDSDGQTDGLPVARVIAEYKEAYRVKNSAGEFLAKVTGKIMFNARSRADYPAVGDWVAITESAPDQAVIRRLLPRKTVLKRKYIDRSETQIIAANLDFAFVIESVDRDFSLNRFERYFAIARDGGITPAVILNKIDLISPDQLNTLADQIRSRFPGVDFIPTSTITDAGLDALTARITRGKTCCFVGSSGVGKSSLINKLIGDDLIKTSEISAHTDRGKHTTTGREMHFLPNGGIVIDNPGMREVGLTDVSETVNNLFDEITDLAAKCKFADCSHDHEPGCAVRAAIDSGQLNEAQFNNYRTLKKESEFYEMTHAQRKQKERQFGKFIKKVKDQLKHQHHKDF